MLFFNYCKKDLKWKSLEEIQYQNVKRENF